MSSPSQHDVTRDSTRDSTHPDDATLVAWLDGELPQTQADQVARTVAANASLGSRVRLLRTTRTELRWALGESETAPPPAPLAFTCNTRRRLNYGFTLLAAAALAIVFTIGFWRANDEPKEDARQSAQNDLLAIKLTTPRAGWDLFSGVHFAIAGRTKTAMPCRIVARKKDETDEQLAARTIAENGGKPIIPLALLAHITSSHRQAMGHVANVDSTFGRRESNVRMDLVDVRGQYAGIGPLLTIKLEDDGASEDFKWGFRQGISPAPAGNMGLVLEDVGEYRMSLKVRAIGTTLSNNVPAFAEPLEVSVGFAVRGVVGKWSEPVDGLSARIVASRATANGKPLAIAAQLRNDSDRPRSYNITGSTIAKIPQPFHFDLMVDGKQWQQRKRLGVISAAVNGFLPQPVQSKRSLIVLADYWQQPDGSKPSQLRGKHRIGIRFHFKPSVWNNGDRQLWMGMVDTPPIEIDMGSGR